MSREIIGYEIDTSEVERLEKLLTWLHERSAYRSKLPIADTLRDMANYLSVTVHTIKQGAVYEESK